MDMSLNALDDESPSGTNRLDKPAKMRPKPQLRSYREKRDFDAAFAEWRNEKDEYEKQYLEWRRQQDRQRDRSARVRVYASGAQRRRASAAAKQRDERERSRQSYKTYVKAAREKYPWKLLQRVRVTRGSHAGRCGSVRSMHNLCNVALDGGCTVQIHPDNLEAWPRIGQLVEFFPGLHEIATVVAFSHGKQVL